MRPRDFDLFGEVVVTRQDIRAWLIHVPRIDPDGQRAERYVINYSVVDKIKAAKLSGAFDALVAPHPTPEGEWWARFHWTR